MLLPCLSGWASALKLSVELCSPHSACLPDGKHSRTKCLSVFWISSSLIVLQMLHFIYHVMNIGWTTKAVVHTVGALPRSPSPGWQSPVTSPCGGCLRRAHTSPFSRDLPQWWEHLDQGTVSSFLILGGREERQPEVNAWLTWDTKDHLLALRWDRTFGVTCAPGFSGRSGRSQSGAETPSSLRFLPWTVLSPDSLALESTKSHHENLPISGYGSGCPHPKHWDM